MELFKCIIEVTSHAVKKNGKQIFINKSTGKRFITSSNKAKSLENVLTALLLREKLRAGIHTIKCDINADINFIYPKKIFYNQRGYRSNRVADLSNLYETVQDAMQKSGIISNDSIICSHNGSGRYPTDDNKYYIMIVLTHLPTQRLSKADLLKLKES
jgi:Holliday junction resolvase RusA-like endonuclease